MTDMDAAGQIVLGGVARGRVVALDEPLSFWGGVDPASSRIIDASHPQRGVAIGGAILLMATSRCSCSGSGVVLDLALAGRAPAALVFAEAEEVATLGALVAAEMFGRGVPVLRLTAPAFGKLARAREARITARAVQAGGWELPLAAPAALDLALSD